MIAGKSPILERQLLRLSRAEMAPVMTLMLGISSNNSTSTFNIKVKSTTPFKKIFNAVARQKGVKVDALRFHFDGERLDVTKSPSDYDMKNDDIIDCFYEQYGGG